MVVEDAGSARKLIIYGGDELEIFFHFKGRYSVWSLNR